MISLSRPKNFLDIFPTPEFLLISSAGIALTDHHIKFVQLKRELFGRGFKLAHYDTLEIPEGVIQSGLLKNPKDLFPLLKNLSNKYGIRYAHATLPEEKAYLFTTTIDRVPREGLRDAVAFIVEENVPVSLAESVFDFEIIEDNLNTNQISVAVAVLPQSVVSSYIQAFESAGIVPVSFDLESQAIARAVIPRGDKKSNLIINISAKKAGLYVVENEVVQFSITPSYGFASGDSSMGSYPGLIDLKAEIRKVIAFWNTPTKESGRADKKIEKIILCGWGARDKEFVKKLMEDNDTKYVLADVWVNTSPEHNYVPNLSFEKSVDYADAVGLILPHRI